MRSSGSTRARTAVVAAAAVAAVVGATTMAGAHEGDDDPGSIHACVANNGTLRVADDPGRACKKNETPLHWTTTGDGDGSEELEAFKQQLLATDDVGDLVDWTNLQDVPQWVLDGLPAWLLDGTVDFGDVQDLPGWLQDGAVDYSELSGSLPADSFNASTVDDGSITGADIASGAITPDKVAPEISSRTEPGPDDLEFPTTMAGIRVTPTGTSWVSITGQVQLSCTGCAEGSPVTVRYEVVRGPTTIPVSPAYSVELSSSHRFDVAGVSVTEVVPAGAHDYRIRVGVPSGNGVQVLASSAVLTAQVVGGL